MQLISALVFSALALVVNAIPQRVTPTLDPGVPTFTTRPPVTPTIIPPVPTETCTCPGRLLCCRSVVSSEDPAAQAALDQLGAHIGGTSVPIGLGCSVYDPRLISCRNPPVCCFDSRNPSIAAIGCVAVPPVRPTLTPTLTPTFTTFPTLTPTIPTLTIDPTRTITFAPYDPNPTLLG